MAAQKIVHPSVEQRRARGREARDRTPPDSHTGWAPAADRPDPVGLLKDQDATREPCPRGLLTRFRRNSAADYQPKDEEDPAMASEQHS